MPVVKAKALISASRLLLHLLDNPEIEALNPEPREVKTLRLKVKPGELATLAKVHFMQFSLEL